MIVTFRFEIEKSLLRAQRSIRELWALCVQQSGFVNNLTVICLHGLTLRGPLRSMDVLFTNLQLFSVCISLGPGL